MSPLPMPFQAVQEMIDSSPSVLAAVPGGYGGLQVAQAEYNFATDGGAQGTIVPALTTLLPLGAIIVGGVVIPTTAPTGTAGATVAIGVAGISTTDLLAATVIASLTLNSLTAMVPTFAAPIRLAAAGNVEFTVAVHDLTAGVIRAFVFFIAP